MVDMMYTRQEGLSVHPPNEVSIIGCGGVGAWVAIDLALAGTKKLFLFDDDDLEISNLNRLPFEANDVGKPKTAVVKKFIGAIRPDAEIVMHGRVSGITKNLLRGTVIDCTDSLEAQQLIYEECTKKKDSGLKYYRIGYDGHHITIIDGQSKDSPKIDKVWNDGSGHSGYIIVPSWAVPSQLAASLLTHIICYRQPNRGPCPPIRGHIDELIDNHWRATKK